MDKLYAMGMSNDVRATQLFLAYIEGKPIETKNIELSSDIEAIEINYHKPSD